MDRERTRKRRRWKSEKGEKTRSTRSSWFHFSFFASSLPPRQKGQKAVSPPSTSFPHLTLFARFDERQRRPWSSSTSKRGGRKQRKQEEEEEDDPRRERVPRSLERRRTRRKQRRRRRRRLHPGSGSGNCRASDPLLPLPERGAPGPHRGQRGAPAGDVSVDEHEPRGDRRSCWFLETAQERRRRRRRGSARGDDKLRRHGCCCCESSFLP